MPCCVRWWKVSPFLLLILDSQPSWKWQKVPKRKLNGGWWAGTSLFFFVVSKMLERLLILGIPHPAFFLLKEFIAGVHSFPIPRPMMTQPQARQAPAPQAPKALPIGSRRLAHQKPVVFGNLRCLAGWSVGCLAVWLAVISRWVLAVRGLLLD